MVYKMQKNGNEEMDSDYLEVELGASPVATL